MTSVSKSLEAGSGREDGFRSRDDNGKWDLGSKRSGWSVRGRVGPFGGYGFKWSIDKQDTLANMHTFTTKGSFKNSSDGLPLPLRLFNPLGKAFSLLRELSEDGVRV